MKTAYLTLGLCLVAALMTAAAAAGCADKDRDYCKVDKTCDWDWATASCTDRTCAIYYDHAHCNGDLENVGPCDWDWALNVCYPSGGVVPCAKYYVDCPTDRCNYDQDKSLCYSKDGDIPCYSFFQQSDCPTDRCVFENGQCMNTIEQQACSLVGASDDCAAKTNCKWNADAMFCWPKDLSIPCDMFYDKASCPTATCTAWETGDQAFTCLDKDAAPACDLFSSNSTCPTDRCKFNDAARRCYDPRIGLDCQAFASASDCPTDYCKVVGGMCLDQEAPVDCSMFYYRDATCASSYGCKPDCDNNICVPCSATDACDDTPCSGGTVAPPTDCYQYTSEPTCPTDNCKWDATVKACVDAGMATPCSFYLEPSQCDAAENCKWDMSVCVGCQGADCTSVTTTAVPDTGDDCNSYNERTCPKPRCIFSWRLNPNGECTEASCEDFFSKSECNALANCTFDESAAICYDTKDGVPCDFLTSKDVCTAYDNCQWNSNTYICSGRDTGKGCSTYSRSNCPSRCQVNWDTQTCRDKACVDYFDQTSCQDNGCTFDEQRYICYSDTGKPCTDYTSSVECPPNRCVYAYDSGASSGKCREQGCSDIFDETACKDAKCDWLTSMYLCYKDTGKPCASYAEASVCPGNRCIWTTPDGVVNSVCSPRTCTEIYAQDMCTQSNCQWDASTSSCFNDTGSACDTYSLRTCPINRCVFDYSFDICRTPSCKDFFDAATCNASKLGCEFNQQYDVCITKGGSIPCSIFNFQQGACPTDRCQYATDVNVCYPIHGKVPCGDIYEQSPCDTRDHCKWDEGLYRCVASSI
eukprot:m.353358 g.353358  ORF g.353358 m.353358 type:complete len:810 (-) comp16744_c0_seq1:282-2711(-)